MLKPVIAHARVRVTLDIEVSGSWGGDCDVDQIEKQAATEALGACRRGLVIDMMGNNPANLRATVVGTPEVEAVLTRRER